MTEPIAYAIHDIEHGGSRSLVWANQYTPEGDPTKFSVVPLVSFERGEDALTKDELKFLADLRDRGFAVCVFNPDEIRGADINDVEARMCAAGWDAIGGPWE